MRRSRALFTVLILLATILPSPLAISNGGWLPGWDYRVQINIDDHLVDNELTHFPVLIKLSNSSGINGTDVTFIFDEVEDNSLKIAVTKADGLTELYVEVEYWNNVTEKAYLWVSKSDWVISNITDTVIYLYYDGNHADNSDFVGFVESAPGEAIWDANYKSVLHFNETVGNYLDSTLNDNDASIVGDGVTRGSEQKIGSGVALAGSNDYILIDAAGLASGWDELTVEIYVRYDSVGGGVDRALVGAWGGVGDTFLLYYDSTGATQVRVLVQQDANPVESLYYGSSPPLVDTWYLMGSTYEHDVDLIGYEDGAPTAKGGITDDVIDTITYKTKIGIVEGDTKDLNGKVDEFRISNIARTEAYMKATHEGGEDTLLTFGTEQEKPLMESPGKLFGAGFNASSPWVSLYWKTNLTDITFFEVQNSTDKISWDYLGQNTTAEYHDFQVVNGTQRYYRVRACNLTDAVWANSTWTDINFETVYFIMAAAGAEGDTIIMGAAGVFWIILIIIVPIVGYALKKR